MTADCGLRIADSKRKRRSARLLLLIILLLLVLIPHWGCSQPQTTAPEPTVQKAGGEDGSGFPDVTRRVWGPYQEADRAIAPNPQSAIRNPPLPADFAPVKIGILPLTELSGPSGTSQGGKLSVFVTLLDAFGSPMKAPGIWRFELYEYIPRSAQAKGPRLTLWPDADLTGPAQNNEYWRDFLRAYEFTLDTQASRDKIYILEATCMCPDGRRLSGEYVLKNSP